MALPSSGDLFNDSKAVCFSLLLQECQQSGTRKCCWKPQLSPDPDLNFGLLQSLNMQISAGELLELLENLGAIRSTGSYLDIVVMVRAMSDPPCQSRAECWDI